MINMKIEIPFRGHKNIVSLHEKTLEITKDQDLTINGDCIIGIDANLACRDLPENLKKNVMSDDAKITFTIKAIISQSSTLRLYTRKQEYYRLFENLY